MFKNTKNSTKQGDIGESRAIYEYTKMGYAVSVPLFDSEKYDLIVDKNSILIRIQIKTTQHLSDYGIYKATLKTSGGNKYSNISRDREDSDYDELFVMCGNGDCYMIPVKHIDGKTSISLGVKYSRFKI